MTKDQKDLVKLVYRNFGDRPLEPGEQFYEPIYKANPNTSEPIERIQSKIEFAEGQSMQFFSGFRGAGKTTELKRLQQSLEAKGFHVVFANALDYINPSAPIDITDLLPVLAGAFSDHFRALTDGHSLIKESFWTRFKALLTRTDVDMEEISLKIGGEVGAEVKLALRNNPTFRQQVQKTLSTHLGALRQETTTFFEESVKAIRAREGDGIEIVFIFDSLEQVRGSLTNETEVINSVESLFSNHLDALKLPYLHLIYTVPPWLKFLLKNLQVEILPSVQQWQNDPDRTPEPIGNGALWKTIERRLNIASHGGSASVADQLFGLDWSSTANPAHRIVDNCGGHFRDLFLLVREALVRTKDLPLSSAAIEEAVASVRRNFLPLAIEDALWLYRIATTRHPSFQSAADVGRLTRFLDSHLVLYFSDTEEWYDVHPLVRPEVERVVRLQAETKATTT